MSVDGRIALIDRLLMDKLPEVLSENQKKTKIHNLMAELSGRGRIENRGSRRHPAWHIVDARHADLTKQNHG